MNRILAVAILVGMTGCSFAGPCVTNISPAGRMESWWENAKSSSIR